MKKFFTLAVLLFAANSMVNAQFITKALDENDEPTFDWSKAEKFIPIAISESVGAAFGDDVLFDATVDEVNRFLYVWSDTYVGVDQDGSINSFGEPEDHIAMDVTSMGWSGCGFCPAATAPIDWSVLDDSWVLHFAIKSKDNANHAIHVGEAGFTLGSAEFEGCKVLGNFERDNEWYYVDIPYSVIRQLVADGDVNNVWPDKFDPNGNNGQGSWTGGVTAYISNYLTFLSGGVQGTQLRLDNIFWYKDNTIEVEEPVEDVYILGEVNDQLWAPNVGLKMDLAEGADYYTATVTADGRNDGYNYFSFTTKLAENDGEGSWDYIEPYCFGAVSEGDFWVTDELLGQPLSLTKENGQAFRVPAGEYSLSVSVKDMIAYIDRIGGDELPEGDVDGDNKVDVADVNAIINLILELKDSTAYPGNADLDGDGKVDVSDVNIVINIILSN